MRLSTLCYLIFGDEVLIAVKKRGFGAGKFNGIGGKVEPNESVTMAMVREAEEEIGVKISEQDLEQRAIIMFSFDGKPDWNQECHVFVAQTWNGEPKETEEMKPEWFAVSKLPFEKMWISDRLWLKRLLSGELLKADFHFDSAGQALLFYDVRAVAKFVSQS